MYPYPNPNSNLNPYPTPNQKPNHYPHSNYLVPEISWQELLSLEQMLDQHFIPISVHYPGVHSCSRYKFQREHVLGTCSRYTPFLVV